jgi:hypothetical protein
LEYDIAEILEIRDLKYFLKVMQESFEAAIGARRFFRITGTPTNLDEASANLGSPELRSLLETPPNPNNRVGGWDVRPLPPLRRDALGFRNERIDFHHMRFIKNGHLEFWQEVDYSFCWLQKAEEMAEHPRLYPYPVVEHPVCFLRLYRALIELLGIRGDVVIQMQYLNISGALLFPHAPESVGWQFPMGSAQPMAQNRLVFQAKRLSADFDPDPAALDVISDLYYQFGYGLGDIPFFDKAGKCRL